MGYIRAIVLVLRSLTFIPYLRAADTNDVPFVSNPATFVLNKEYVGQDFFTEFDWEVIDDPTHGTVNYVDLNTAQTKNLTSATCDSFVMRADSENKVRADARGRDSIRIISRDSFEDSIILLDVKHIPWGCATWPAFWTLSSARPWPYGGEIDIIEGVNENAANLVSLHTAPNCVMLPNPQQRQDSSIVSTDCNAFANYNQGCGISLGSNSYGPGFNAQGGGWYVMKRTQADGVYVWFWARNDPSVPDEVRFRTLGLSPDPITWGLPSARFPSSRTCNFGSHFTDHKILFDLTFCGDWAGNAYNKTACDDKTCVDLVRNYPEAFKEAYWEINALMVYTPILGKSIVPSLA